MILLSFHAEQRVRGRTLMRGWIEATVVTPDWTEPDPDPSSTHSFKVIADFGNRVWQVVHRPNGHDVRVVTDYVRLRGAGAYGLQKVLTEAD